MSSHEQLQPIYDALARKHLGNVVVGDITAALGQAGFQWQVGDKQYYARGDVESLIEAINASADQDHDSLAEQCKKRGLLNERQ